MITRKHGDTDENGLRGRQSRARSFVAALAFIMAGCSGITEPLEIVTVESALEPADGMLDPVTGSVAMVIRERETQIGIGVRGGMEGARFGWAVRNGSCSESGERVGPSSVFPPIEIAANGEGGSETVLFRRISVETSYAAELFAEPDGTGQVQACADLVPGD